MQDFIEKTIREAGEAVMNHFGHAEVVYTKEHAYDVVTQADLDANAIIVSAIRKKFPDHAIVSEEEKASDSDSEYVWYIDPLDGTKNFATHVPLFGINIALAHKGVVTHGAVLLPVSGELYYAEQGKGAWVNGKPLACSKTTALEYSYGLLGSRIKQKSLDICAKIFLASGKTAWVNSLGSIAVSAMYVASGRRDWCVGLSGGSWDYAAPSIILLESGCKLTDTTGKEWDLRNAELFATNPTLHKEILKHL